MGQSYFMGYENMKKTLLCFVLVLCASITDIAYNAFVRAIVLTPVKGNSLDYRSILLRRSAFVIATSTNTSAVTAAKCFMFDIYQNETGIVVSSNTALIDKHGFRHWVDEFSYGDGFMP